eukprot:6664817-Pyramimonas_sp.AAC.1
MSRTLRSRLPEGQEKKAPGLVDAHDVTCSGPPEERPIVPGQKLICALTMCGECVQDLGIGRKDSGPAEDGNLMGPGGAEDQDEVEEEPADAEEEELDTK